VKFVFWKWNVLWEEFKKEQKMQMRFLTLRLGCVQHSNIWTTQSALKMCPCVNIFVLQLEILDICGHMKLISIGFSLNTAGNVYSTAPFWVITQQAVVISYQHLRTTYCSHVQKSRFQQSFWILDRLCQHVSKKLPLLTV
jgi:hypothetical protein